jgi:hypothetical protein
MENISRETGLTPSEIEWVMDNLQDPAEPFFVGDLQRDPRRILSIIENTEAALQQPEMMAKLDRESLTLLLEELGRLREKVTMTLGERSQAIAV